MLALRDDLPAWATALFAAGQQLVKTAADPEVVYNLAGTLYLSSSGWLLLSVPNAFVRGVFAATAEPGIELPPGHGEQPFNAHVSVMSAADLAKIGGADRVKERGRQFRYSLGRVYAVAPDGWPEMSKVFYVRVHSPELQALRRAYGLSGLPRDGDYDFHITTGVVRKGVLGRNDKAKVNAA